MEETRTMADLGTFDVAIVRVFGKSNEALARRNGEYGVQLYSGRDWVDSPYKREDFVVYKVIEYNVNPLA